ncbi:glycerophosphodiester phosphodiesterase [Georgenia alba]|uniref:Glycerophosphodiester phosphodiesterase n=1 Tax=Georgenia alba TaxID=2233858 RepID=A0ABW2Q9X7_9MICO
MSTYLAGEGPVAIAHRGGSLEAPENSRAAVEHTLALGLRYFETDVRTTRDGVAVLFHDPTVERVTGTSGAVEHLSWEELSRLRDASGSPPLRLEELLGDYPDLRVNIDAKDEASIAPVVAALHATRALDRVCVTSFDDARVHVLRTALGPQVATGLGRRGVARLLAASRLPARAARTVAAESLHAACVQVPPTYLGLPVVTGPFVETAHRLGLAVHVWTIDEPAEMRRLLDLGVDGLVTDRPSVLKTVLDSRGPWH